MLQPLQLQEVAARYPKEIGEVRDFLVKAGFTPGTASSLGTVTDRLRQDRTMRRDLTSHVWVVLYTVKASYAELLALVTLAAAGPQFAADADEDQAHELLRFLMGARGEFEGSGAPPRPATVPFASAPLASTPAWQSAAQVAETPAAPATPVVAAAAAPTVAAPPVVATSPVTAVAPVTSAAPVVAAPVVEAPLAAAVVVPVVETPAVVAPVPVVATPVAQTARARFAEPPAPGNLRPLREPGNLPPLRWGASSHDSDYDSEPEPEGRMAFVAVVVCLLAVLLFGVAIWRYQYVQRRQAEVRQQEQEQRQKQIDQDAAASAAANAAAARPASENTAK